MNGPRGRFGFIKAEGFSKEPRDQLKDAMGVHLYRNIQTPIDELRTTPGPRFAEKGVQIPAVELVRYLCRLKGIKSLPFATCEPLVVLMVKTNLYHG